MDAEDLVERLASDVRVVPRSAIARRIGAGLLLGACVTFVLVVAGLGVRPDLVVALHGLAFWTKISYAASVCILSLLMTARLSRPEPVDLAQFWPIVLPCLPLAILGLDQMWRTPADGRLAVWLGATWKVCPWLILGLSLPIFAGLAWSLRGLAATRLHAAGAATGFAASACAAVIYCLHCPETSAVFVLTWYTAGILLAGAAGALVGPRLLRW